MRSPDERAEADRANYRFTLQSADHSLHVFHRIPPGFLPYRTWTVPVQKHRESDTVRPPRRTGHRGELRGSFVPRASSAPLCAVGGRAQDEEPEFDDRGPC